MPFVYELIDLIKDDRNNPSAYFQDFEQITRSGLKRKVWLTRDREFGRLDQESWQDLKEEASPYLLSCDTLRGWSQLISILNQARGYNFLIDEGCRNVRFVPRSKFQGSETQDLKAEGPTKVLCESTRR